MSKAPSIQKCLLFEKQKTLLFPPAPKAALSEASQYKDACCLRSRKGGLFSPKSPHFGVTGSISSPPVASWSGKCGETSLGNAAALSVWVEPMQDNTMYFTGISIYFPTTVLALYILGRSSKRLQSKGGFELVTPVIAD